MKIHNLNTQKGRNEYVKAMGKSKETYYLVEYGDMYDGRKAECVCTEKGWEKWIKETNDMRDEEDKWEETMEECEELGQFIFTEIEVYN